MDKNKMSLAAKLARIGKEIGKVEKSGKNQQQNYNYIEYGVVAGRIRELFDEYGVIIIPSVVEVMTDEITNKYGNTGYHYKLNMQFSIINGDDMNDKIVANWIGESADYGDKGINKAETSGTKYFLMRLFNVSEKGEEEADSKSPAMKSTQRQQSAPTDAQRKELSAYLMELGKTDEEIAEILGSLNDHQKMLAAIAKARKMVEEAESQGSDTLQEN